MGNKQPTGHIAHSKAADVITLTKPLTRPLKIVFLGAGSCFFSSLFVDVMNIPGNRGGEMAIVDTDPVRLELAHEIGNKIIDMTGKNWTVSTSTERQSALKGADYIINCIEVSGVDYVRTDYEIPARYGVRQCIGDTGGPGGLMKALRTAPVFLKVLKDVEQLCPDAWVFNYTNPMSIMCLAAHRSSSAKVIGLCHSVQNTTHQLAEYLDIPYKNLHWHCGGINHLAWFTELNKDGKDLYPVLLEKLSKDKQLYEKDPVRFDMMQHFGYFITESSGHLSEYLPYYRKRPDLIEKYCRPEYLGENGFYARNWPNWRIESDKNRQKQISGQDEIILDRSWEYASYTIQAIETNDPFIFYATMPNNGLIENLSQDGMVEVACVANEKTIKPTPFKLPSQCAAICESNMRMYDLAATACVENSREAAVHSLMLDPLTAAVCCPAEIKKMADELFEAQKDIINF